MKIQARQTGDVIEINDDGARTLIDAGIYDALDEPPKKPAPEKAPPKKSTQDKSTRVEPMTTEDMPASPAKKAK